MKFIRALSRSALLPNSKWLLVAAFSAAAILPTASNAQPQTNVGKFVPFPQFVNGLGSAKIETYASLPNARVKSATAFEAMREHLLSMYSGMTVAHSYVLGGQTFDCVPIMQQPSVRLQGITKIAAPPPPEGKPAGGISLETRGMKDAFGNVEQCAAGTIPMRRMTLDELTRFESLQQYFKKSPESTTVTHGGVSQPVAVTHRWSLAYQNVNNYGGTSQDNVWVPSINTGATQVFSLSQQWYAGGSGNSTQTAEVGWQNFPQLYGSQSATLFIYWTRDDYTQSGCYNLTCVGFVQTNSNIHLGRPLTPASTLGGTQYEVQIGYYLYQGNWWLTVANNWVGYYPTSIYKGGQMSHYATLFEIGGETVGGTSWPPMGSGQWAARGDLYSAYERGILYRDSANGGHNPSLTPETVGANAYKCFSYTKPAYSSSNGWLTYFFFGGPGGTAC